MATQSEHDYMTNVLQHKAMVGIYMAKFVHTMMRHAVEHDFSKFGTEEFEPYAANQERFAKAEYGSDEYKAACEAIKPALEHHVKYNSHHPEAYPNGINDMSLFDIVEMVCDWCAACQRNGGDTLRLDLQKERFKIDNQLYGIIVITAHYLLAGDHIRIIDGIYDHAGA